MREEPRLKRLLRRIFGSKSEEMTAGRVQFFRRSMTLEFREIMLGWLNHR
jgi:hypothetical protein